MSNTIRYLERAAINLEKWNRCVDESANGLIYAYSWWLDGMADNWSALVMNDYEAIMPLTWKRKYGFQYLYQPWFTPSLGIFKKQEDFMALADYLSVIPGKYRLWDFQLNECNKFSGKIDLPAQLVARTNFFVEGNVNDYPAIYRSYSRLCRRKLALAAAKKLRVAVNEAAPADIIKMYQRQYAEAHPRIRPEVYDRLSACCKLAFDKGLATGYTAVSPSGTIEAFYLVLHDQKYAYSLIGGSTNEGKKDGAFYLLTDAAIQHAAAHKRLFRFEGSDIPGIAFFNRQFGPVEVQYTHVKLNRLPFWAKWFKKTVAALIHLVPHTKFM